MLRVRKRCVNWLHLVISWSGPCCPVFLGPDGGGWELLEPTWKGSSRSGRDPQGSRYLLVAAARPGTPPVFLRLFAGGSGSWRDDRHKRKALGGFAVCRAQHAHDSDSLAPRFSRFTGDRRGWRRFMMMFFWGNSWNGLIIAEYRGDYW